MMCSVHCFMNSSKVDVAGRTRCLLYYSEKQPERLEAGIP